MLNPLKIGQRSQNTPETVSSKEEKNQPGQQQKSLNENPEMVSSPPSSTDAPPEWVSDLGVERGTAEETEAAAQGMQAQQMMLGKDDFHRVFCGGFQMASAITGLKSLNVEETDAKAEAASKALYDTILDVPMLHFLLMPQGKWLERAAAIGMFTVPMVLSVRAEIALRQTENGEDDPEPSSGAQKPKKPSDFEVPDFDRTGKYEAV